MRWWLLILTGLVSASLILSAIHPQKLTIGTQLLAALDADARRQSDGIMPRAAIELIDYVPQDNELAPLPAAPWKRGEGSPMSLEIADAAHWHWIDGMGAQFIWHSGPQVVEPLRVALAPGGVAAKRVRTALNAYYVDSVDAAFAEAGRAWAVIPDEKLVEAWLRADRATLSERDHLAEAVREAWLVEARATAHSVFIEWTGGDVLIFESKGNGPHAGHVYIVPLTSDPAASQVELDGYDLRGRLQWTGILHVRGPAADKPPDATRVRLISAYVARVAFAADQGQDASTRSANSRDTGPVP